MKVFKFGGASVSSVERILNLGHIMKHWDNEEIVVIVSAMGKTTNALEEVVDAYVKQTGQAQELYDAFKERHLLQIKKKKPYNFSLKLNNNTFPLPNTF